MDVSRIIKSTWERSGYPKQHSHQKIFCDRGPGKATAQCIHVITCIMRVKVEVCDGTRTQGQISQIRG